MKLHYEAAVDAADTLLHNHVVNQIWDREISAWAAEPGTPDVFCVITRLPDETSPAFEPRRIVTEPACA